MMLKLIHWHAERVVPCLTHMWRHLGWEQIFSEAQHSDRQTQLDLQDNICSIVHAQDLPENTLEDLVLIFAYLLVSSACSVLNKVAV